MKSSGSMRILGTDDAAEWLAALERSRQHDFHHLPQYHRVAEQRGEGKAHLFVFCEDDCTIALPLLMRPVDPLEPEGWQDATSVYGYAGPVTSHETLPAGTVRNFQIALADELARRRTVAVFSRLHPMIAQEEILAGLGECPANGHTISIDLTVPDEAQRARYHRSCRATLRKLRESGFTGFHDREKRYLPEFVCIYLETMRRARAEDWYFFDESYFNLLTRELAEVSHLFVALKDGEVAAATLCTICDGIVQDHLGGTRDAFLKFSPDRLVVDTERLWASEMGARVFHLGGGVGAQQDSVFRYKSGFSDRRHTFQTWRWILRPDIYEDLSAGAARRNMANGLHAVSAGYFPAYRCAATPIADEISAIPHRVASPSGLLVLHTAQEQEWKEVLADVAQHDFYHLPEYHRVAEERGEGTAHLFAWRDGEYTIALPLLLRPIGGSEGESRYDATSVYGYAGPLASHDEVPAPVVRNFQRALKIALIERSVVAVFSRLHPLIPLPRILAGLGDCRPEGQTVSIDLTLPPEEQRTQYRASFKTRINKLRRHGLVCLRDVDKLHLPEFTEIYHQTMSRVKAHDSYFFEPEYFKLLTSGLGPALELFVVTFNGAVIAGGLFTICNKIVQYHLGGTSDPFLKLAPMQLVIDTVRLWANDEGARIFHLGGGVGSNEDSLFHFKAGFSDRRHVFPTWRWIIEPEAYRELCEGSARRNLADGVQWTSADYFPQYRCPTVPVEKDESGSVVIIGAGGHAKVVISTLIACGTPIAAVFDDDDAKCGMDAQGIRVRSTDREHGGKAVIGIGNNTKRMAIATTLNFEWATVVHPSAYVHPSAKLGRGTVILAGALVQPDAVIGDHVIVNTGATIDHDCVVGDYAHLGPGVHLAGSVQVGEGAFLGIGSVAIPGVKIGRWSTLGAGAVAIRDIADGAMAVGVPAKVLAP